MLRRYAWLAVFAIAMAFLESAVVVYLRLIFYPDGFVFPLIIIPEDVALIELGREAATLVMLVAVGWLAAERFWSRFSGFMFAFGVWDIWYYIWLKLFVDWPESPLTWDVLFLIPVVWASPVLAPVIIAICLCGAALIVERLQERLVAQGRELRSGALDWLGVVAGGIIVIVSFTLDWKRTVAGAIPQDFRWGLYSLGLALALVTFALWLRRAASSATPS